MAGHSKWANIRIRKGAQDAKRGKMFTKVSREIIVAARSGGGDPTMNARLRLAIQKAREVNMPMDNIDRAVKKGTGELDGEHVEELAYEGYGPHGVALLLEIMTDNRNRTAPEIRTILGKRGGNLGETGCVAWMFEIRGLITVSTEVTDEETLMLTALDAGADDIREASGVFEVTTSPDKFIDVRSALEAAGIEMASAEVTRIPTTTVALDEKTAPSLLSLLEELEDHDDVQRVHANFDVPDDVLERLAAGS